MAKKAKHKKSKVTEKKSKSPVFGMAVVVVVVIAVLAISGNIPFIGTDEEKGKSFNLQGKETKPVLDPSQFTGVVRAAYAAAEKYPEVMNQVFCYCFCDAEPFNHKTLLSCFTDKHGMG